MSVVIIGGHERMENRYKEICKKYKHKPKVFTKIILITDKALKKQSKKW